MIGNAVEINEAIEVLRGIGPSDVTEVVLALASRLLVQSGVHSDLQNSEQKLNQLIESGEALNRLAAMVESHGGDLLTERPVAKTNPLKLNQSGFVQQI